MGKTFAFILGQEEALEKIRYELNAAKIGIRQETPVQYGIKFTCENGAIFILYFSKGKASKIYFEKEIPETVSCIEALCNNDSNPIKKVSMPIYASYQIPEDKQELIKQDLISCFSVAETSYT